MTDREKVISWVEGLAEDDWRLFHSDSEVQNIAKAVLALLKEQETASLYKCPNCGTWVSAKNVVRCKDCIYKEGHPSPYWKYWCNRLKCGCDDDWYCADGEKKER